MVAPLMSACRDPRKPSQNGTNESFNGKLRDECLSRLFRRWRTLGRPCRSGWTTRGSPRDHAQNRDDDRSCLRRRQIDPRKEKAQRKRPVIPS